MKTRKKKGFPASHAVVVLQPEAAPARQHAGRGAAGPGHLLWEDWERGDGDAAGQVWTGRQLSAEGQ